ncbi:hypothetical protein EV368DRAFT_74705 [Lentinula lateritia]|nr:hypothetical protein EV368DRAFT_74705 [Lentinula lateritia]
MHNPNITKGTKVRLWTLQILLPNMPPVIVAAIPITDKLAVDELLELCKTIVFGLLDNGINLRFSEVADSFISVNIPGPREGIAGLHISIPVFKGHPIAMVQDSKHALKTFRNNLFSGAQLLALGNYVAFFQQIHNLAFEDDSPLYHRDIVKLDRQDDNAASRLFSASTLKFLSQNHPDQLGVIIHLFVFGELCDAYQNRHIEHVERINILLCTRYFVDMWQQYIKKTPCYKQHLNFLSRESVDIILFLINGLISLIIIHRDHFPYIPLLAWLHSSKACEHFFSMARQIVKDFTMLDFYQMVPKLLLRLHEAKLDIIALGCFPLDAEIQRIARKASEEANSLIGLLGIPAETLHTTDTHFPGVDQSFPSFDDDDNDSSCNYGDLDEELDLEIEELQNLIHLNEQPGYHLTSVQQDQLELLPNASIALTIDEQVKLHSLPEIDNAMYKEFLAQDRRALQELEARAIDIPNINVDQPVSILDDSGDLSFTSLLAFRGEPKKQDQSLRHQILDAFHTELRSDQDQGLITSEGRSTRWKSHISASVPTPAAADAKKALAKHRRIFLKNAVPCYQGCIETARVTEQHWQLWFFLTMYSKGGGKHGKHAAISTSTSITSLSYIAVQLYEHSHSGQFRQTAPKLTSLFHTHAFALLPSHKFLTVLSKPAQCGQLGMLKSQKGLKVFQLAIKDFAKRKKEDADEEEMH